MNDDIRALEAARDALWIDVNDQPKPSVEHVSSRVVKLMYKEGLTFQQACRRLIDLEAEAAGLEARARALRS